MSDPITTKDFPEVLRRAAQWVEWEPETIGRYHEYAYKSGCPLGHDVHEWTLKRVERLEHELKYGEEGWHLNKINAAARSAI